MLLILITPLAQLPFFDDPSQIYTTANGPFLSMFTPALKYFLANFRVGVLTGEMGGERGREERQKERGSVRERGQERDGRRRSGDGDGRGKMGGERRDGNGIDT